MPGANCIQEFDYAFSDYEQIELWTKFVLPLAVVRYPREELIIRPSEVKRRRFRRLGESALYLGKAPKYF